MPGLTERILAADPDGGVATQMLCFELGTDPPGQGGLGGQCRQEHL